MTASNFEGALSRVLAHEGGFVNHPLDPGGATNLGITRATLAQARGRPVSVADVAALTRAEAAAIYRRAYWDTVRGDDLPDGIDLAVFDLAVNSGPSRAARLLQRVLGVAEDGRIGPRTLAAARAIDARTAVRALARERLGFLQSLATWPAFGRGWGRRVEAVERQALELASSAVHQPSNPKETIMIDAKSILASRTVWANLIGLAALVSSVFGFDTGDVDVNGVADAASRIVAAVSFIASTAFRVMATKQIAR